MQLYVYMLRSYVHTHTHIIYIYMYDGLPKCLFLVLLINRNSFRAASYLAFRTITYLNSLKPCISFFTFEAVAKTLQHMLTHVCMKEVPLLVELEYVFICCRACHCLCCHCCFCQRDRVNYKFSGGDWVRGQPKPFFETCAKTCAIALLAGI